MPTLHVVIPYFNEGDTIGPCVAGVRSAPLPEGWATALVIVDDASAPEHVRALDALAGPFTHLRHERNRGKGAALQTGFDAVLDTNPPDEDLVIIQDADLEYDPADYAGLIDPILAGRADVVIGTRWGDHRPVRGVKRRLHAAANGLLTLASNAMTGYRVHDMECCYKVLPMPLLRRLRPWLSEPRYGIEPQMVAALARLKARVSEAPVQYDPRSFEEGKKIGWLDGVRAVWVIARERLRRRPPA